MTALAHYPAPIREYSCAADMRRDAAALKARMYAPTGVVDEPEPPAALVEPYPPPRIVYRLPEPSPQAFAMKAMTVGFWCPSMPARAIMKGVAGSAGYRVSEILADDRRAKLVAVRWAAMIAVAQSSPNMSISAIAGMFKRDHTTVLSAFKRAGYHHGRKGGEARS